ncbi:hypothetical protein NDU88_004080 [Pleurodeles waltl]|uniref:Uncharacterized protein n=1 Tax=Pleurodeles waltl TaxID=8319 RepID=A0AAV7V080_PLEWA|nr:hypothetical protein NDU88_004080 [Pleurodeles waltl]
MLQVDINKEKNAENKIVVNPRLVSFSRADSSDVFPELVREETGSDGCAPLRRCCRRVPQINGTARGDAGTQRREVTDLLPPPEGFIYSVCGYPSSGPAGRWSGSGRPSVWLQGLTSHNIPPA